MKNKGENMISGKHKVFMPVLLAALLTAEGAMPVQAAAAEPVRLMRPWLTETADEGQCGDDIYYTYDAAAETVTVEGTGETWDYDYSLGPTTVSRIFKVSGDVKTLRIGSGITEVKAGFIPENETLETVFIPKSVVKIGNSNFHYNQPVTIVYEGTRAEWDAIDIDKNNGFKGCTLICAGEWFAKSGREDGFSFAPRYLAYNREAVEDPDHTAFRPSAICGREQFDELTAGFLGLNVTSAGLDKETERWYEDVRLWAKSWGIPGDFGVTLIPYTCCSAGFPVTILYCCC